MEAQSAELTPEICKLLDNIAKILLEHNTLSIYIDGHAYANSDGINETCKILSTKRAKNACNTKMNNIMTN